MPKKVSRKALNIDRYNACIAKKGNIYAFSWYLDVVCNKNWFAYVWGDYNAVCPVPQVKKWGINWIQMPDFCQQLGTFGETNNDKYAPLPFLKLISYASQELLSESDQERRNYILDLSDPLHTIEKKLSKNRIAAIRKAKSNDLFIDWETNIDKALTNFDYSHTYTKKQKEIIPKLIQTLIQEKYGFQMNVYHEAKCVASAIFGITDRRIYYLLSGQSQEGRKLDAHSFMLYKLLERHADTPLLLDFEGSMLPGVAAFFKSFGAKNEAYFLHRGWPLRLSEKLSF